MDIDINNGEALIEEIQNDWIRNVKRRSYYFENSAALKRILSDKTKEGKLRAGYARYMQLILGQYEKIWAEATLSAAIWFLTEELGIRKIYYHTPASGCLLKGMGRGGAPTSLYSQLPEKFCFQKTNEKPWFLENATNRRIRSIYKSEGIGFYCLSL
jgi:hypothetical protein